MLFIDKTWLLSNGASFIKIDLWSALIFKGQDLTLVMLLLVMKDYCCSFNNNSGNKLPSCVFGFVCLFTHYLVHRIIHVPDFNCGLCCSVINSKDSPGATLIMIIPEINFLVDNIYVYIYAWPLLIFLSFTTSHLKCKAIRKSLEWKAGTASTLCLRMHF